MSEINIVLFVIGLILYTWGWFTFGRVTDRWLWNRKLKEAKK